MSQFYIDPARAKNPHALPDGETFNSEGEFLKPGWYWWACFPGCLPDTDPIGPFESEDAAIADARAELID